LSSQTRVCEKNSGHQLLCFVFKCVFSFSRFKCIGWVLKYIKLKEKIHLQYVFKKSSQLKERERENATRLMCRGEKGKIKLNNRISALEPPRKPQHSAD